MPPNPEVTVQELTVADGVLRASDPSVKIDDTQWAGEVTAQITGLIGRMQTAAKAAYLLTWHGRKVPRGAVVGDHMITYTQSGVVTADFGDEIGTYQRLVEFGGPDRTLQQMVVFLD
jgi:hypothetical protein